MTRPSSLRDVSLESGSLADFGGNLREWLHEVRRFSSRLQLQRAIEEEPALMKGRFPQGQAADAWLAAYAEYLSSRIGLPAPEWAFAACRIADEPWFAAPFSSPSMRARALIHSPLAFKRRNLYTSKVDLPLRLSPGRPRKAAAEKRASNAERQRRHRERRSAELQTLRNLVRRATLRRDR
jgi:hypothetical protein